MERNRKKDHVLNQNSRIVKSFPVLKQKTKSCRSLDNHDDDDDNRNQKRERKKNSMAKFSLLFFTGCVNQTNRKKKFEFKWNFFSLYFDNHHTDTDYHHHCHRRICKSWASLVV